MASREYYEYISNEYAIFNQSCQATWTWGLGHVPDHWNGMAPILQELLRTVCRSFSLVRGDYVVRISDVVRRFVHFTSNSGY